MRAQDAEARQREELLLRPRGRVPLTNKHTFENHPVPTNKQTLSLCLALCTRIVGSQSPVCPSTPPLQTRNASMHSSGVSLHTLGAMTHATHTQSCHALHRHDNRCACIVRTHAPPHSAIPFDLAYTRDEHGAKSGHVISGNVRQAALRWTHSLRRLLSAFSPAAALPSLLLLVLRQSGTSALGSSSPLLGAACLSVCRNTLLLGLECRSRLRCSCDT